MNDFNFSRYYYILPVHYIYILKVGIQKPTENSVSARVVAERCASLLHTRRDQPTRGEIAGRTADSRRVKRPDAKIRIVHNYFARAFSVLVVLHLPRFYYYLWSRTRAILFGRLLKQEVSQFRTGSVTTPLRLCSVLFTYRLPVYDKTHARPSSRRLFAYTSRFETFICHRS